jgi:hypothetical protein
VTQATTTLTRAGGLRGAQASCSKHPLFGVLTKNIEVIEMLKTHIIAYLQVFVKIGGLQFFSRIKRFFALESFIFLIGF